MRWGPGPLGGGRWRFRLWAPGVERVTLELSPLSASIPMGREEGGWFVAEANAAPGHQYRFRLPRGMAVPDPASRAQVGDVHGWSLLVDPDGYRWRKPDWRGRPWEEAVVYEVHAGLLGGFRGIAEELPRLADLGVTAVELMPVADFSGRRNWGYDGVLPYAPASAYGTPDELKELVDCAHGVGLMMLLDVVYNHFGPDGNYLHAYAGEFFDPEIHTPWGAAIAFDREPVRRFFIDNALMWLNEYRFDGLRLDAVHAIEDPSFLDFLLDEVRGATGPDRHVHLVLENEHNDAGRIQRGYDAQWNDDFHNVAHVILTGETSGYYRAFAERPTHKLARALSEGFIYQGSIPAGANKPRGTPSAHLPPSAFVAFLQNHDQVGNRALGERLTTLTGKDRLRAATALLLLMPQIPLFFMGDEIGSETPFLFFTDFHDELAEAVREGRRGEFAHFPAFADAQARERIPDPNDPQTFERSKPKPGPDAKSWTALYRELLAIRAREIVPRLAGARPSGAEVAGDGAVLARWRMGDGAELTVVVNLGEEPAEFGPVPEAAPLFSLGRGGDPGSFAAWLERR